MGGVGWPPPRITAVSWTSESGLLYLFGGYRSNFILLHLAITSNFSISVTTGYSNDLWSFNISSRNWNWRGGSNGSVIAPPPTYPDHVGGVGWPGGTWMAGFVRYSPKSTFIFGNTRFGSDYPGTGWNLLFYNNSKPFYSK